ncbi:MAG: cupredoxin domain-containing protein [Chloroflexota bacterium]
MLSDLWNRLVAWTGTIVSPDWGALVALIPILLLLAVVAYLVITAWKWAGAGPRQRGGGRRTPVGPDGLPLRGPTAAPFIVAIGAFILAFGLVAGGPWLPAGIVVALVGLVSLALESGRDRRTAPPSPSPLPGPGAPSRPLVTPARATVVAVVAIAVIAIGATSKVVPDAPAASATIPPVPSSAYEATLPPADVTVGAFNVTFTQSTLTAPAGRPFTVAFDNRDNVPHNLEVRDAAGKSLFVGDIITGPKVIVYTVPALAAGQYPFVCTVHPGMIGTLTVK